MPPAPFPLVTAFTHDPDGRLIATQKSANGAVLAATGAIHMLASRLASATDTVEIGGVEPALEGRA